MQLIAKKTRSTIVLLVLFICSLYFFHSSRLFASDLDQLLNLHEYNDPQWRALLYSHNDSFDIHDSAYYFSSSKVSLKEELIESYNHFFIKKDAQSICKFPARYLWLAKKINKIPDFSNCDQLSEFIQKAPFDILSVVFASENITSPTSMMGHIFLKISGNNEKKEKREHSISFFTEIEGISFSSLVFKSLISGMEGRYALAPYGDAKNVYLHKELRNIWEFDLKLDSFHHQLIQFHLYELKNISFTYLFHGFNCATLINNILAVVYPETFLDRKGVVTPLDVVRKINKKEHVEQTHIYASDQWKITAMMNSFHFDKESIEVIKNEKYEKLNLMSLKDEGKFLTFKLAKFYNDDQYEKQKISEEKWRENNRQIDSLSNGLDLSQTLDLSSYKKPYLTPPDSQIEISYLKRNKNDLSLISFLPASHSLEDDNSNYNDESSLKMGNMKLGYNFSKKKLFVDSIVLYSVSRYKPVNEFFNNWSGKLEMGYRSVLAKEFKYDSFYFTSFGLGKTYRFMNDIDAYGMVNSGFDVKDYLQAYLKPEIGFIIREVWGLKTIVNISRAFYTEKVINHSNEINILQSMNIQDYTFNFSFKRNWKKINEIDEYGFSIKYIF